MVWSQQAKLVGTGAVGPFEPYGQGVSVSLSGDGNTAIVGGSADNGGAGAAWVFTRSGGVWSQQGPKPVGTGAVCNAQQGWSVSLSGDGNTAIVGGLLDNNSAGAAWVYTRLGGVWGQQGPKLVGTGAVLYTELGSSASLSGDGNTAIVGGFNDNGETGAAWVFTRSGGVWSEQGPKLVGTGAVGHAGQGVSVSLSSDGNTAIVGGTYDNDRAGAAWVYTQPTFAGIPGKANCFGQSVTGCKGSSAASMPRPQPWGSQASGHCRMQFWRFAADSSSVSCSLRAVSRVPMPGRIDHAEMRPDRMERRMGLIPASPNSAVFGSGSAPRATLRFKASIRLMTLGGSAIARGVVASPFVFASTSSHSAL